METGGNYKKPVNKTLITQKKSRWKWTNLNFSDVK